MKASVEYITPEAASKMLLNNPTNRELNERRVRTMADQMKRGAWLENGASIVMNGTMLLDGQHRLNAIIMADVSIQMVVVRDVDHSAFGSIDTGKSRSLADVLHVRGEENAKALANAIKYVISLEAGGGYAMTTNLSARMTHDELAGALFRHQDLRNCVSLVSGLKGRRPLGIPMLSALLYKFRESDRAAANTYIKSLVEGVGIEEGSVTSHIYQRLQSEMVKRSGSMKSRDRAELIVRGWNHIQSGTNPRFVKARASRSKSLKRGLAKFPAIA